MNDRKGGGGKREKLPDEYEKEKKERENIVYIKYADHVLYRNIKPKKVNPIIRETVGWIAYESKEYLLIEFDRSLFPHDDESFDLSSGLLILKNTIVELIYIQYKILRSQKNYDILPEKV